MRISKRKAAAGLLALVLAAPGCSAWDAMSGSEHGAVLGGLAGAGIGRAIGQHNGHEAVAGWAGAGLGALVGGLIGKVDDQERGARNTTAPVDLDEAPRRRVRRETVYEEDLPPIPPPTRVVRRTTTTVYRTVERPVVQERVIIIDD